MRIIDYAAGGAASPLDAAIIDQFYAPVEFDALTTLVAEHDALKDRLIQVHELVTQEQVSGVMEYFFSGNSGDQYGGVSCQRHINAFKETFRRDGALNELTSRFWEKALAMTNLMEVMPQKRRDEWKETLNAWRDPSYKPGQNPNHDLPVFNRENLQATLQSLMARRSEFIAERVDGIFRELSSTHVTNTPEGFNKRMIISGMFCQYGSVDWRKKGYIHDLRLVISKFMGRDEPDRDTTDHILNLARLRTGEWLECDGGSLRVKAFKVGTAHLEVHPQMAYRLNGVLAFLYPSAIPHSSRRPPKRTKGTTFKTRPLFERPLSNALLALLEKMETYYYLEDDPGFRRQYKKIEIPNTLDLRGSVTVSKHLMNELETVMHALGGVRSCCPERPAASFWQFDYAPRKVLHEIIVTGCMPDTKSYQFYPTPRHVAQQLVDMAELTEQDTLLEPSAGQGGIADLLPRDNTTCVEISELHCAILRDKGHRVIHADFLEWNPDTPFSAILMNPPYSEGRWQAHLAKASTLVSHNGRLMAVLPSSAVNRAQELLPGFDLTFSQPISDAFDGTSITVVLLKAVKTREG